MTAVRQLERTTDSITIDDALEKKLMHGAIGYRRAPAGTGWVLVYPRSIGKHVIVCYEFELNTLALRFVR